MTDDNVLRIIHLIKFSGYRELISIVASTIVRSVHRFGLHPGVGSVLVPTPMTPAAIKRRGFNQAERIAAELAREFDTPFYAKGLRKISSTAPQSKTAPERRASNVRGVFAGSGRVAGRHVLLVDDLVTTGATAGACAAALLGSGAAHVDVICFGRAL
jgi:ComF family protein